MEGDVDSKKKYRRVVVSRHCIVLFMNVVPCSRVLFSLTLFSDGLCHFNIFNLISFWPATFVMKSRF